MEMYLKQIEIGKIVSILNADKVHTVQVLKISGPEVYIGWYANGKDYFQWITKKRLAKLMEKEHEARIKASNEAYQNGEVGHE